DRAQQETGPRDLTRVRGGREHGGQDQRVAVQRGERGVVVELEALDEAGVEHRGRRGAGPAADPADDRGIARVVENVDTFHSLAGDGELGADQRAGDAVEQQVLGVLAHGGGNVVQRGVRKPGGKPARGPIRVSGGAGGFVGHVRINRCRGGGHVFSSGLSPLSALTSSGNGHALLRRGLSSWERSELESPPRPWLILYRPPTILDRLPATGRVPRRAAPCNEPAFVETRNPPSRLPCLYSIAPSSCHSSYS